MKNRLRNNIALLLVGLAAASAGLSAEGDSPRQASAPASPDLRGLTKLEALGMIESGNNDAAVGGAGEVSRYQIKPRVWEEYSESRSYRDARLSSRVAAQHLVSLEDYFRRRAGREPSDFDRYVLWNAGPVYYRKAGFSPNRVNREIRQRAARYANLRQAKSPVAPAPKSAGIQPKPAPAVATPTVPLLQLLEQTAALAMPQSFDASVEPLAADATVLLLGTSAPAAGPPAVGANTIPFFAFGGVHP